MGITLCSTNSREPGTLSKLNSFLFCFLWLLCPSPDGNGGYRPTAPVVELSSVASTFVVLSFSIPVDSGPDTFSNNQARDWGSDPVESWNISSPFLLTHLPCSARPDSPCNTTASCPEDIECSATPNTSGTCMLSNLIPSTNYTFTVSARNPQTTSLRSEPLHVTTLASSDIPNAPSLESIQWYTSTQVQVSLQVKVPLEHGASEIVAYRMELESGGTVVKVVDTVNACPTITISGLSPSTSYSVRGYSKNSSQISAPSSALSFTTAGPGSVAEAINRPLVSWYTSTSVSLRWNPPRNRGASQILRYRISVTGGKTPAHEVETAGTNPCAVVTGLTPGAGKLEIPGHPLLYGPAYVFSVRAENPSGLPASPGSVSGAVSLPHGN